MPQSCLYLDQRLCLSIFFKLRSPNLAEDGGGEVLDLLGVVGLASHSARDVVQLDSTRHGDEELSWEGLKTTKFVYTLVEKGFSGSNFSHQQPECYLPFIEFTFLVQFIKVRTKIIASFKNIQISTPSKGAGCAFPLDFLSEELKCL